MPINHTSLTVSDYNRSKEFYTTALKPLGYKVFKEFPNITVGFAAPFSGPDIWLTYVGYKKGDEVGENEGKAAVDEKKDGDELKVQPVHMAFTAKSERQVKEWYEACLYVSPPCFSQILGDPFVVYCIAQSIHALVNWFAHCSSSQQH
jgi:catechol 2,3-dioxygenase-like lactoylglutathione lyase family enzyme